jgi:iron(III) transport system ATP-binding protein
LVVDSTAQTNHRVEDDMLGTQIHSPVSLAGVQISYGGLIAVDDVNMEIESGEFFTLLGPSGCGKTTLLRTIAGFNRHTAGTIRIGDVVVDDTPAYARDTGMVFQNYAIFPHLTVWENVAYGLVSKGVARAEIANRVAEALSMVDLTGYDNRMPKQLSGGQQQRVVIARAIVIRPRVLLMDEPLANLDAKLRVRLREDLRALQQRLGITTIYVTHDQEEALSISDRIAVMNKGRVLQVGTPEEVYAAPSNVIVARFVGEGTFLEAELKADRAQTAFLTNGKQLEVGENRLPAGPVLLSLRPQDIQLAVQPQEATLVGTIRTRSYFGPFIQLAVDVGLERDLVARLTVTAASQSLRVGDPIGLKVDPERILGFPFSEVADA